MGFGAPLTGRDFFAGSKTKTFLAQERDMSVPQAVVRAFSEASTQALLSAMSEVSAQQAQSDLSGDLLEGALAIAKFVFGDASPKTRRKIYHLCDIKRGDRLPAFRVGSQIFARRSTLLRWIAEREAAA
jgi:hypothetical protein